MTDTPEDRPTLRLPLKNFRFIGDLTPEKSEWWHEFGRHLKAAQHNFPKPPRRWPV